MKETYQLDLLPRHMWLRKRTEDCCAALLKAASQDMEWDDYRQQAKELATELLYTVEEWEKYYPHNDK